MKLQSAPYSEYGGQEIGYSSYLLDSKSGLSPDHRMTETSWRN